MMMLTLESELHLGPCRKNLFAFIAIFVIVVSIYSNTFYASWHFDDETNILKEKAVHLTELSWENIKRTSFFTHDGQWTIYRPAARVSLALNYYFGQEDVLGYHLVNLAIHFFAALFLFFFVHNLLNLPLVKAKYGSTSYSVALLAAVLWAVNPVQTQAVTYIVQRMASMAGMFYIMAMFFYLKARMAQARLHQGGYYAFCLVASLLAFASKENAAMLPISIFFLDLFLMQGLEARTIKRKALVFLAVVSIPLGLALLLKGPSALSSGYLQSAYSLREYTLLERLLTESRVVLFYITQLFYPMPDRLCLLHDISISKSLLDPPTTILSILVIILTLAMVTINSKRWPLVSYCILFFFLNHLIESTVFGLELVFEHRNYIPSMLLFVPVAILAVRGIQFFSYRRTMQVVLCAFVTMVLVGHGHSTFMRNFVWKTEESLWLDTIDKSPGLSRPHHNLGRYYGKIGLREKEIAEYEAALALQKGLHGETRHITHHNLALAYKAHREEDKAVEHLKKAIDIDPRYSDAYNNLAAILIGKRNYDEAFHYLIKALTFDREHVAAHHNLGVVALKKRLVDEAINEFRLALAGEKETLHTLLGLGAAYKYKKDFFRAQHFFRRALQKNPRNGITRLHLIETLYLGQDKKSLDALLEETLDVIPPEIMKAIVGDIAADKFPDQEAPDLEVAVPLLGEAYLKRSDTLENYGSRYLEKASRMSQ